MPMSFRESHAVFGANSSDSEDDFGGMGNDRHGATIEEFCQGIRCIVHVDLDCFYCQVEHKRLSIPTAVPLAVRQWQGLVAVNYAARAAGVVRHDNINDAREKCPEIKLVHVATYAEGEPTYKYHDEPRQQTHKVSLEPYRDASKQIFQIIAKHVEKFERASVDEAYLDLTDYVVKKLKSEFARLNAGRAEISSQISRYLVNNHEEIYMQAAPRTVADLMLLVAAKKTREIRAAISDELQFTCSAGVAHNKTLAKLCSSLHKPNKQTILLESTAVKFLEELPISKIRMLGGKLGAKVESSLAIKKCGELQQFTLAALRDHFDPDSAQWLYEICRGICHEQVVEKNVAKSMMAAKSLRPAITSFEALQPWLTILCGELYARVIDGFEVNSRWPKTLVVTTKSAVNFEDRARSGSFPSRSTIGDNYEFLLSRTLQIIQASTSGPPGTANSIFPAARVAVSCSGFEVSSCSSIISDMFSKAATASAPIEVSETSSTAVPKTSGATQFAKPVVPLFSLPKSSVAKSTEPSQPKPPSTTLHNYFSASSASTASKGEETEKKKSALTQSQIQMSSFGLTASSQTSRKSKTFAEAKSSNTSSPKKRKMAPSQASSIFQFAQGKKLTEQDYDMESLEKSSDGLNARCPKCKSMQPIGQMLEHLDWHLAVQLSKQN